MNRSTLAVLLVALLTGCDCDEGATSPQPTLEHRAAATEPATEPEAPAEPAVPEARPDVDVGGLTARRLDDGRIEVHGADRWGGRVDTTYESAEYLRNALPVLERSITEEQATALRTYVESLEED